MRGMAVIGGLICALALAGCGIAPPGAPQSYLLSYNTTPPKGDSVTICSGYGCTYTTEVRLTAADFKKLSTIMAGGKASGEDERAAIRKAVAWLETRTGAVTGLSADRDHRDLLSGGDPTQADCIDEAANSTSYLLLLDGRGLLRHHSVRYPTSKGLLINGVYPHATALIEDRETKKIWAVDSWIYANGEPPLMVPLEVWRSTSTQDMMKRYGHKPVSG